METERIRRQVEDLRGDLLYGGGGGDGGGGRGVRDRLGRVSPPPPPKQVNEYVAICHLQTIKFGTSAVHKIFTNYCTPSSNIACMSAYNYLISAGARFQAACEELPELDERLRVLLHVHQEGRDVLL